MKVKVQPSPEADDPVLAQSRQYTLMVYVLHAVMSVTFVTFFVAIFINYARRDAVRGTIYESHFDWQIRTFWFTLVYFLVGLAIVILGVVGMFSKGGGAGMLIVGILILFVNFCWHLYRVIRGLMRWSDRRPMDV
jgi:uncharacterized membrane protein